MIGAAGVLVDAFFIHLDAQGALVILFLLDAFFIHLDAQGALVILFLPIYQWLAAFLLILICAVLGSLYGRLR
jgi:hypothetical protein